MAEPDDPTRTEEADKLEPDIEEQLLRAFLAQINDLC